MSALAELELTAWDSLIERERERESSGTPERDNDQVTGTNIHQVCLEQHVESGSCDGKLSQCQA